LVRTMPGRAGKLHEAVSSIIGQIYQPIELVIVEDGGSTAQKLSDQLRLNGRFTNVIYLPLEKGGRCRAGNAALAAATGELMCFLDDDDLFYADHLEVLVDQLQLNPELGAVYGLSFQINTEVISEEPWAYRDKLHSQIYRQPFNRGLLWHHNYLPIQTVLFQRHLYDELGGFDPELDNLEDWNLWVRYSLKHDFQMVEKLTSIYRVPFSSSHAIQRQQVLDDYYAKAQAKHSALRIELSPPQVVEIARELAREFYAVGVSTTWLRRFVLRLPIMSHFYHTVRRFWHVLQRVRRR
ncbi:MAG: hypothetical protein ACD_23C00155G0002, partial [uncultured bacterium]